MVDVHESKDYPITLGDSLKVSNQKASQYLSLRYNWTPKGGFEGSSGSLKHNDEDFQLTYDLDGDDYHYSGWDSQQDHAKEDSKLALIYDESSKSFRLEKLAASINLNLKSATNAFAEEVRKYRQIPQLKSHVDTNGSHQDPAKGGASNEDDTPDASNPFDYRHFLAEAQETADKVSQPTGNRTPLPGGHTPLSGLASPMPGATSFPTATTPQFKPTEIVPPKRKSDGSTKKRKAATTSRSKPTVSRAAPTSSSRSKVLSKDIIVDSDEEADIDLDAQNAAAIKTSPPVRQQPRSAKVSTKKSAPPKSPQITLDNNDGLQIDEGSPPRRSTSYQHKVNAEAFGSSRADTPQLGRSPMAHDVEMQDANADDDDGFEYEDEPDEDHDVESLQLEDEDRSPPPTKVRPRRSSREYKQREPSPPRQISALVDDDADDLAAELEAALEEEGEDEAGGVGLGIEVVNHDGDESEISEEE